MKDKGTVLVVDDDETILYAFQELLEKDGFLMRTARDGSEAVGSMVNDEPSVVFMDISMPVMNGLDALREIKATNPYVPVVLITGYGTMETAVKAMQLGAFEYITKPLDIEKVRTVLDRALRSVTGPEFVNESQNDNIISDRYELIGKSRPMEEIYKLIGSISTTPNHTSVLILGESGTGKELVARSIHRFGDQKQRPFISINCTTLPESLLESELFGHERGAFTGAIEKKLGKFEIAGKGTIFLDEIGNLSPELQQKLLRVLQEREFERVGGNTTLRADARFIAATNKNLPELIEKGEFREDLYYRLNVVTVEIPPLRERREDVQELARHFLKKYGDQLRKNIKGFTTEAMNTLEAYAFPGNVRELENLVERAVMLTNGEVVLLDALSDVIHHQSTAKPHVSFSGEIYAEARASLLREFDQKFLTMLLKKHRGNVSEAARASGMTRQNLQRLMKQNGISSSDFKPS